jgi:HEAT repeat protein
MGDTDAVVRRQAVAALSRIGTFGVARQLSILADSDPSPIVRQAAAAALQRRTGTPERDH